MKKIFGGINLTWKKIIIMAVIIALYTSCSLLLPITKDTSFSDLGVTFEVWIFLGIFIIMNSKSAKDSALKCFVFFLISQPLIYLFQVPFSELGWQLFRYYKPWLLWTFLCLPMGYIGYYIKKDKWWGLLILGPILVLLVLQYHYYIYRTLFSFPRHILTVLFCIVTIILYPLFMFNNKKIKIVGVTFSILLLILFSIMGLSNKPVYSTEILMSNNTFQFDDSCNVLIEDETIGKLSIIYIDSIDDYSIHGDFIKEGNTSFVLECKDKYKKTFDLKVKQSTYEVNERIDE